MINGLVPENDPLLELEEDDFSPDVDSTVLIRERTRGSKLDGGRNIQKEEMQSGGGV